MIARGIRRFGERDRERNVTEKLFDRKSTGKVVFVVVRVKVVIVVAIVSVAGQVDAEVHDRPRRAEVAQVRPDFADILLGARETAQGEALEWFLALRESREEAGRDWSEPTDGSEGRGGREKVDHGFEQFRLPLKGCDDELLQCVHRLDRLGRSFDRRRVIFVVVVVVVVGHVVSRRASRREPQIEQLQVGEAREPGQKWVDGPDRSDPQEVDADEARPNGAGILRTERPLDGRLDPEGGAELLKVGHTQQHREEDVRGPRRDSGFQVHLLVLRAGVFLIRLDLVVAQQKVGLA